MQRKERHAMTNAILQVKHDAVNPHVRSDEGVVASVKPRRGSPLHKGSKSVVMGGLTLLSLTAAANTLVWWRFEESVSASAGAYGSTPVVNAANPGTYDGECYRVSATSWTKGSSAADAPHSHTAFPEGVKLYDPVTQQYYSNGQSLLLGGNETGSTYTSGSVKSTDPSVFKRQTFTAEAFFCVPTTMSLGSDPYPIFGISHDTYNETWTAHYYQGKLYLRYMVMDGEKNNGTFVGASPSIADGKWHHAAIVADGSNGTSVRVKFYLDYKLYSDCDCTGRFVYDGNVPDFNMGVNPYASMRKFPGCVDEFRFSDSALDPSQFLRFRDERYGLGGPLEADVVVWQSLDPWPADYWFADLSARNRGFLAGGNAWTLTQYQFGGSMGKSMGDRVAACVQDKVWSKSYGVETANGGSFRTINKETVTVDDQKKADYFLLLPPEGATPLTDGDFTLEYFYKSNGENKLGANCTLMILPTDANNGDFKTPEAVMQHYFTAAGSSVFKYMLKDGTGGENWIGNSGRLDSHWHHIAYVYEKDAKRFTLYVDRKLFAVNENFELLSTAQGICMGAKGRMWNNNYSFDGWLDEVRLTRRALRKDELLQLRANPPGAVIIFR